MGTLFLIESPNKIEKLKHILGDNYTIMAQIGHVMDLDPHNMSIDIENNFTPTYINNEDKSEVISKLKTASKKASKIIFATDPDREGEMISWSLAQVLKVNNPQRVTYTEITKDAVLEAVKHPRDIDMSLIDAQKTRRMLDRIVGYEISPLLVKLLAIQHLSAGRVQSVIARLIIDRENEIKEFLSNELPAVFKFTGEFHSNENVLKQKLFNKNSDEQSSDEDEKEEKGQVQISSLKKATELMEKFCKSKFIVGEIGEKILTRNPSPPFQTSSLQQTSQSKLGFTIKRTMTSAQNLYEAGYITYLRTDSVNLSQEAINNIKTYVLKTYGKSYYREMQYKSKSKNTQEAHEAIRPTDINNTDNISGKKIGNDEIKLYSLIWKRQVASQMTPAKIKQLKIHININNLPKYEFISQTETIEFAGFLKVYNIEDIEKETETENNVVSKIPKKDSILDLGIIIGKQGFPKPPSRYDDGSLINKIKPENLNIGRPATYQAMISVIQDRGYVIKGDTNGIEKDIVSLQVDSSLKVNSKKEKILLGKETNKFIPTELGFKIIEFLMKYFADIMDYHFTSEMEERLDDIAEGKTKWLKVMKDFYKDFHPMVDKLKTEMKDIIKQNTRLLGQYPETGADIVATFAKFGSVIKMKQGKKFIYAPIKHPLTIETITLQDAIKLFEYPKVLGKYEDIDVVLQKGKFGFYIMYDKEKISVGNNDKVTLNESITEINKKMKQILWKGTFGKTIYKVLDGKFGLYINVSGTTRKPINVKLPKDTKIDELTIDKVKEIVSKWKPKRKFVSKKKT